MSEMSTMKVSKQTKELLKLVAEARGRRESLEQVVLELLSAYGVSLHATR